MTTPTKESMEKARFIADNLPPKTIDALLGGGYETRDALIDILALEFTNYQKRVEELENLLVRILREEGIEELGKTVAEAKVAIKSHLAKGVKEG